MKNKIVIFGSLIAVLALGLVFAGCDAQLVKIEYSKLASPANVTASVAKISSLYGYGDYYQLTVRWDAVAGADGYSIVATQEGKNTIYTFENYAGGPATNASGAIPDIDKWEYVSSNSYNSLPSGTFKIGVIAHPRSNDKESSNPAWAPTPVTIPID